MYLNLTYRFTFLLLFLFIFSAPTIIAQSITGFVYEKTGDSHKDPLEGVNVYWAGTTLGTITDSTGYFKLKRTTESNILVFSYIGYKQDTIEVQDTSKGLQVVLSSGHILKTTNIVSSRSATHISGRPIHTQVISTEGLKRAACCNLSESFESTAAVDVSYSDAVSGAKQIQMLGLAGIYSQIMLENTPYIRGLSTPFGLMYMPGSWMEEISISKGTASVINGYESITGQINVNYKKPENCSEDLFFNFFFNSMLKSELNANLRIEINDKITDMLFIHVENQPRMFDNNQDGFTEVPLNTQINIMNRWDYNPTPHWEGRSILSFINDSRTGGQNGFRRSMYNNNPAFRDSSIYGIGIEHQQLNFITKNGLMLKGEHESIGTIVSYTLNNYQAFYGKRNYNALQHSGYANAFYENHLDAKERHKIDAGVSFQFDNIDETFENQTYDKTEIIPGLFTQYSFILDEKFIFITGARLDYHNLSGLLFTPRLHLKWQATSKTTVRYTIGKGYRTANPYIENSHLMASSRKFVMEEKLNIEEAYNTGLSFTQKFDLFGNESTLSIDYFYTHFLEQVIADVDKSPYAVYFHNLKGSSYSHSILAECNLYPFKRFELMVAYRFNHVMETINGELKEKALVSPHKMVISMHYATPFEKWKFDFTTQVNGSVRLPKATLLPETLQYPEQSPAFATLNAQISRQFKHWEFYLGAENLTDYTQEHPIIDAANPFGSYFDASVVYAPLIGRMFYIGCRFLLKHSHHK